MKIFFNASDPKQDEVQFQLIEMLFDQKSDVEEIAYAGSWLSFNLPLLSKKVRNVLIQRLNQPGQLQPILFLRTIEYMYIEDRHTELIFLTPLLKYAPETCKQIEDILMNPRLAPSYKYARMLLLGPEYPPYKEDMNGWDDDLNDEDSDIPF